MTTAKSELSPLLPGSALNALQAELPMVVLPAEEIVAGEPSTGAQALVSGDNYSLGIWEMTSGIATDVEVEECFVVLQGRATVTIHEGEHGPARSLELSAGSVGRLSRGMRTEWVVHEDLRKIYVMPTT